MKNILIGNIAKFIDTQNNDITAIGFIIDVINTYEDLPRIMYMKTDGKVKRINIRNTNVFVLPLEEQIQQFNYSFYKFVAVPKHLKNHIKDK